MSAGEHHRGRYRISLALAALAFAASGSGVGAAQLRRRPLDFVTPEARPKPLNDPRRISEICARLADVSVSYDKRAEFARALSGAKSRRAVEALTQALLEPSEPNAISRFRTACAQSLRWAASGGDKHAINALYEALVDPSTEHGSGQGIAKAILDARGAAEVLRKVMKQTIHRATGGDFKGSSDHAWSRIRAQLRPYHMVTCVRGRNPSAEAMGLLATAFRRSSDTGFVALLDYFEEKRFRLHHVIVVMNAQDVLLRSIIRGIWRRKVAARAALLRWLEKSTSAVGGEGLSARLDSAMVRELAKLLVPRMKEKDRKRLLAILDKTCHGRAQDVIAGRVELSDVVLVAAKKRLEIFRAGRRPRGYPAAGEVGYAALPVAPWSQLAFEFKRGADHPYVDVLKRPDRYPQSINLLWNCRPGAPVWEIILKESVKDEVRERLATMTYEQVNMFGTFFALAMNLAASAAERCQIAERAIRRAQNARPEFESAIVCAVSVWAFATGDHRFPVQAAEWIVALAERASRDGLPVRQADLAFALENLTPEKINPEVPWAKSLGFHTFDTSEEADAFKAEFTRKFLESQEKPVSAETAAAWRAWLERFRKLPVFRKRR